jgi:branched-chain amino acid transport system substrate-binding protein
MRKTPGAAVASALAVAVLGLSACGNSSDNSSNSSDQPPLRMVITSSLSTSGVSANDKTAISAAKAAVATVNAAGGVLGKPVELSVVEIGNDPTSAVSKLQQKWTSSDKPAIYLQVGASTIASATLPIASQNKVVSFNQAPTADSGNPKKFPYNFDLSPSTPNYAEAFCPELKSMNAKSIGIIYNDTPFAESLTREIQKQCGAAGLTVVGREKFKPDSLDVTPQLSALQAKNPDVLVVSSYGAPSGYVLQGRAKLGWKVPIVGDNAFMVSPVVNTPPPAGMLGTPAEENIRAEVFQSTVYQQNQPEALTNMIAKMKENGPIPAPLIVGYAYDEVILAAEGAKAAGTTTDAAKIAKAIQGLPPGGPKTAVFPAYHFSPDSHSANVEVSSFKFTAPTKVIDGQFGAPGSS